MYILSKKLIEGIDNNVQPCEYCGKRDFVSFMVDEETIKVKCRPCWIPVVWLSAEPFKDEIKWVEDKE